MRVLHFIMMTLAAMLTALVAPPAAAEPIGGTNHITIRLVSESEQPTPGSTATLALASQAEPGWHGYWSNPGDAGLPIEAKWTLPDGVTAGPLQFPLPQRLILAGLMNYVYEGPFTQLVDLNIPASAKPGRSLPITVKLNYLVCSDSLCVPENKTLSTVLTVGDGTVQPDVRAQFDTWRQALPKPLGGTATYQRVGNTVRIAIPFPASAPVDAAKAYFFPATNGVIANAAPQTVARDGDRLLITVPAGDALSGPIDGVLKLGPGHGLSMQANPGVVPAAGSGGGGVPGGATGGAAAALAAFFGAVLGGLLLNIMPCVFPILSLKALSLARSGETEAAARREALAYTAGVVLVCLALGGALLGLRAAGSSVGWAFQLQQPAIILILLLLTMGIALNLTGLFELAAPGFVNRAAAGGTGGAFATGALAAFIATPCTGPFMGAALGAALVLPWPVALAIFAGLGIGLALPFLAIGFIPVLRRKLPKPGGWMETFRHILSVPMFATALALAWVLGQEAGVSGMTIGLGAALLLGIGLWWTGGRQHRGRAVAWLPAVVLGLVALGGSLLVHHAPARAATGEAALGAEPFSTAKLAKLRAEDRPVFAYFTADWCLTCKVNEANAIDTDRVAKAFADHHVAVLVGDWTDGDATLGRFIQAHNRAGVPLYLWYPAGGGEPRVLPQVLTSGMLAKLPQ